MIAAVALRGGRSGGPVLPATPTRLDAFSAGVARNSGDVLSAALAGVPIRDGARRPRIVRQ